jgi:hypothetical protein
LAKSLPKSEQAEEQEVLEAVNKSYEMMSKLFDYATLSAYQTPQGLRTVQEINFH